jgi:uncharacterized SAM-binding protein YcdF (DUF218 family)
MRASPSRFLSRRAWLLSAAALVVLVSLAAYAFQNAGVWLVREDPLQKAQFVLVLSGGLPDRALAAAEVFRASHAKEVWLTRPMQPAAAMQQLDLPYSGEEEYSRMVLIAKGVPPDDIRILRQRINNTADELEAVFDELQSQPDATVIVVTSKAHTRRVRSVWKYVSGETNRGHLLIRAAPQDSFDPQHWWRTTNDVLSVVREYLGLINAWAGLPLRHAS